jgi:hypothetical protein
MSNGGANFLITQDRRAADPGDARYMLRTENRQITGLDQYVGTNRPSTPAVTFDRGTLTIPDDTALVMIGNTQELLDACEEAARQGIVVIQSTSDLPLKRHYVRMKISWSQNDTLIIIGSQRYWANVGRNPGAPWNDLDRQDRSSLWLYNPDDVEGGGPISSNLRYLIQWIKSNDAEPTLDKDGATL